MGKYLTVEQAAEVLGVCQETVRRLSRSGLLHFYRPAGTRRMYFTEKDIENYLGLGSVRSIKEIVTNKNNTLPCVNF